MSNVNASGSRTNEPSLSIEQNPAEPQHAGASTMIDKSNSSSNLPSSPGAIGSTRTNSASEDERNQIVNKLKSTVKNFRNSNSTKMNTITSILAILRENTNVLITQSQKEATFDSYLTEILSIQSTLDESREISTPDIPNIQLTTDPNEISANRNAKNLHDSIEPESDNDEDKPSKKQKLLEHDMPWFTKPDESTIDYCNPSCKEGCQLLQAYNQDISKFKFFIKITSNSPTGIPSSQWECIFRGDAVNLNQIFTSLHHVIPDKERTGCLGDMEIVFGVSESKKQVTTTLEWLSAWRRALRAIGFTFPHWKEELLEYGDYIESESAAKLTSSHHKIILYDIALQNKVASGQHSLLTDF